MPIQQQNIKLVAAQVMADVPEGGGAPTPNVIEDGASNAIFDDISELDRAAGRVNLRKTHVTVQTPDTDGFFGANVIVAEPPQDPRVSVTLFTTADTFDRRSDAANRVEAYLFSGPEWNGYLYENHIVGQRTIQLFQRPGTALPPVGRTLVLIQNEGLGDEIRQYVRVINVESEERIFTESVQGNVAFDYAALIVSCELSDTLRDDFKGSPASRYFRKATGAALTRDTRVTDAAKYYGVSPLAEAVALGAMKAKAETIFTSLVPSAQTEIPLANQMLNAELAPMIPAAAAVQTFSVPAADGIGAGKTLYLPGGCAPKTFRFDSLSITDDGFGGLLKSGAIVGTIDYATGTVVFGSGAGSASATTLPALYQPAAQVAQQTQTLFREVTAENRRYNWIETLLPTPAPGTLSFAYRAQGNWYVLRDNGNGELRGEDSVYGAGTINYVTGNMAVTTGVLPDADTSVMLVWATGAHYALRTIADMETPGWTYQLLEAEGYVVEKNSVTITWESASVTKTLTDDGSGFLNGDGYGLVSYSKGALYFVPSVLPDPGTTPAVTYAKRLVHEESFHPTADGNGFIEVTVAHPEIAAGSVAIEWETLRSKTVTEKSSGKLGGVSWFSSALEYDAGTSTQTASEWMRAIHNYGALGSRSFFAQDTVGKTSSSQFSTEVKSSLAQRSQFRTFSEQESTANDKNVVVQKTAFDNGAGVVFGTQAGSVNYATGVVRFKPTDVARTASWGLQSGGSFKTEQSSSSSTETDQSWAGSNKNQIAYAGGGVTGTTSSAGVSTRSGASNTGSSGNESDAETGRWGSESFSDEWGSGSLVKITYTEVAVAPSAETETLPAQDIKLNLSPMTAQPIVAGSVMFRFAGGLYVDRNGKLILNPDAATGAGTEAGTIDYQSGAVRLAFWSAGQAPTFELLSCLTRYGNAMTISAAFRTAAAPLKSEALQVVATTVNGEQLVATADADGEIAHAQVRGKVNYQSGIALVAFGAYGPQPGYTGEGDPPTVWLALPVDASTIRYNAVAFSYLPLDADILGLDPVRLPQDGLVPMFRKGDFAVIGNTQTHGPLTVTTSQTVDVGRTRLSRVRVLDADGQPITSGYTHDLNAGTVTFIDVTGTAQPVTIEHRIEDMVMVSDAQINGQLTFTRQVSHAYPVAGSFVSSALVAGDLRARVSALFDQGTWNGTWQDTANGSGATASFNDVQYPIVVTNAGAVAERWCVRFTNTNNFEVIGEHVGVIATGNTSADCSPGNPATGVPYFTLPALGWGLGWSAGNVLRFNTVGAQFPVWVLRTIQQGPETVDDDSFTLLVRGDVDKA